MQKIKTAKDLREDLIKKYEESKTEKDISKLSIYTATVSSIIRSAKTELDYNKYKDNGNTIDFLEPNKED